MDDMITFSVTMLQQIAEFLATPPIFYLFCLICFIPIIVMFKKLIKY